MKDGISEWIVGSGIPESILLILGVAWVAFLVYIDRDEYKNWSENSYGNKIFLFSKVFALIILTVGAIVMIIE